MRICTFGNTPPPPILNLAALDLPHPPILKSSLRLWFGLSLERNTCINLHSLTRPFTNAFELAHTFQNRCPWRITEALLHLKSIGLVLNYLIQRWCTRGKQAIKRLNNSDKGTNKAANYFLYCHLLVIYACSGFKVLCNLGSLSGLYKVLRNYKLIFSFLNQNICCGYSNYRSQWDDYGKDGRWVIINFFLRSKVLFIKFYSKWRHRALCLLNYLLNELRKKRSNARLADHFITFSQCRNL